MGIIGYAFPYITAPSLRSRAPGFPQKKSFSPLPCLPTSHTSQTVHTVPLYLEWYLDPSNAHSSYAVPL